jgi:CPA1 family monovalent cation:H+ antiporter
MTSLIAAVSDTQSEVAQQVIVLIILLLVATGVAIVSRRLRLPYVTGLVVAGLLIAEFLPRRVGLDSSLIFNLFLPILLFEAAINTDVSRLRSTITPITLLAVPGVVIAAGVTTLILKLGLGLGWVAAALLGIILAITDTVSVIAVFKEVSVPARLTTVVEGESLFNDGMALVLFSLILKINTVGNITIAGGIKELLVVILGGGLVGLLLGYLGVVLYTRSEDSLSNILLTVAIALGTYQVSQTLGVSGVVAVVVAGLVVGNMELSRIASASSRLTILSFWEYAGFGVNTFIFLLIGLEFRLENLAQILPGVLLAIIAYQAGRFLSVYPLMALARWVDRPVPLPWQHVLFLGNIKGSLSMALALSLPPTIEERGTLIAIVFGAVLVSLVGQGVSLPWLISRFKLAPTSEVQQWIESLQAQLITAKAAQEELDSLLKAGVLPKAVYEELRANYQVRVAAAERSLRDFYNRRTDVQTGESGRREKLDAIRRRLLTAEKDALNDAQRKRILSEEVVRSRLETINQALVGLEDD